MREILLWSGFKKKSFRDRGLDLFVKCKLEENMVIYLRDDNCPNETKQMEKFKFFFLRKVNMSVFFQDGAVRDIRLGSSIVLKGG